MIPHFSNAFSSSPTISVAKGKTRSTPSKNDTSSVSTPASALVRTTIALEYSALRHHRHCPLGMYVLPSVSDDMAWDGVLFVHQGYYADAVLKFRLRFPLNYPEQQPTVCFLTEGVFHPLVSQKDGSFNLSPRFRPWRPKEHHVFDILHYIKSAFKKHALDKVEEHDCLNKEAYRLYHDTTSSFAALASQSASLSQTHSALYDKDPPSMMNTAKRPESSIQFQELKSEQLREVRSLVSMGIPDSQVAGA